MFSAGGRSSSSSSSGGGKVRRASHAGSWYTDKGSQLNDQLSAWLSTAASAHCPARAIIAPHAGYSYCGQYGGEAYKQIDPKNVHRVFILGPSHHVYLKGCALTATDRYKTPLYDLTIDRPMCDELMATGHFEVMNIQTDEDEHSIEMHLPYIAKVMESKKSAFNIVPVLVGNLSFEKEAFYGQLFSKYLADPHNLFVISSDFCHWGKRFNYTYYDEKAGQIYQSIEALDRMASDSSRRTLTTSCCRWCPESEQLVRLARRQLSCMLPVSLQGMQHIETLDPKAFAAYQKQYQNTICGRHPIGVLLNAIDHLRQQQQALRMSLKFLCYGQSSQCRTASDSSVSYASASLVIDD